MVNQTLVVFFAAAELFFLPAFDAAGDRLQVFVFALNQRKISVVRDVLRVLNIEERLGEAQVIDSVQQVGFALTVQSDKTIDLVRETQVCLADILII